MVLIALTAIVLTSVTRWAERQRERDMWLALAAQRRKLASELPSVRKRTKGKWNGFHSSQSDYLRWAYAYDQRADDFDRASWRIWAPVPPMRPVPPKIIPNWKLELIRMPHHPATDEEIQALIKPPHARSAISAR